VAQETHHPHPHHKAITAVVAVDQVGLVVLVVAVVVLLRQVQLLLHLEVAEMVVTELPTAFQVYPHTMPVVAVVAVDTFHQDHLVQVDSVAVVMAVLILLLVYKNLVKEEHQEQVVVVVQAL
jgi:hypothetical protein